MVILCFFIDSQLIDLGLLFTKRAVPQVHHVYYIFCIMDHCEMET